MSAFKDPSFQDRGKQAAEAKQRALDALRNKPPVDPAIAAERQAGRARKEAAEAEKRRLKEEAIEEAKRAAEAEAAAAEQAKIDAAEQAKAAAAALRPRLPTEAERKAARDARYAARKNRK